MRPLALAAAFALSPALAAPPVAYVVENAAAIPASLTGAPGDPAGGLAAAAAGGCGDCHRMPEGLARAAAGLGAGGVRLAIVNLAIRDPEAPDHAFHDLPAFDPKAEAPPQTRLTAAQVEDLVAWLMAAAR